MSKLEEQMVSIVEDLIEDIEEQKCVLLIGPEIIQVEGKSLIRYVHESLLDTNQDDILYYYRQDSLFLFQNEKSKFNVSRQLKRLYQKLEIESDIYRRIIEIPFHVIISLNPDTFLPNTASSRGYGIPHHFHFFMSNGEANEELVEPNMDTPLIYNLVGCVDEDESLVLDYEDLFRLLRRAFSPDGLPNNLRKKLKEARSFLFLGFDFEKWYSQLLLQLLTGDRKGRQKFAINTRIGNSDARDFLLHQFSIEFLGNDQRLFNELYEGCKQTKMLRELRQIPNNGKERLSELKELIGENEIELVLESLEELILGTDYHNDVIALKRRYREWDTKKNRGTLRPWEENEVNIITDGLLAIITQFQQDSL